MNRKQRGHTDIIEYCKLQFNSDDPLLGETSAKVKESLSKFGELAVYL